jgi:hypothetical protein
VRREAEEEDPAVVLVVRDSAGQVVRRLIGPAKAGFHRVAWDLRYPTTMPVTDKKVDYGWSEPPTGFLVPPGSYSISLATRVDGVLAEHGEPQSFEVIAASAGTLPGTGAVETAAFLREVSELQLAIHGAKEAIEGRLARITTMKRALDRSTVPDLALDEALRGLERRLLDLELELVGDRKRRRMGDATEPSVTGRLEVAVRGNRRSTYGPTATHRRSLELARERYAELQTELSAVIEVEMPALERQLDDAGVPWTPGRGVPEPP